MGKFTDNYRRFLSIKYLGFYRFCWIPSDEKGNGIWASIEFFDEELEKLDKQKIEVVIY